MLKFAKGAAVLECNFKVLIAAKDHPAYAPQGCFPQKYPYRLLSLDRFASVVGAIETTELSGGFHLKVIALAAVTLTICATAGALSGHAQMAAAANMGGVTTAPPTLSTAAIDRSIYRDGEVRRTNGRYAAWGLVCDEVVRLGQRFCSLKADAVDAGGTVIGALTVSTGQDGRPAALLLILPEAGADARVEISSVIPAISPPRNASVKAPNPAVKLRPVRCSAQACTLIWTLPRQHIEALNRGDGLKVRYALLARPGIATSASGINSTTSIMATGIISAYGFADAVQASMHPTPR